MPIFMDRHDMKGTRPEDVAQDHLKDLEVQDRYGVKWLTYWFDEERGTTFCLVDAPDKETAQQAHREAHGHVAGEIIEVALSAVEAFLGRISDPKPATGSTRMELDPGIRTIMFTDIVGSTEMTARLGDRMATELVRAHDALVRRALSRWGGREVKHTGDGIMASFDTTSAAAECARTIQQTFASYNLANAEPIHVRIGLHAGEPVEDNNDLFGSTVQLASRLCGAAEADQILVSQEMRDSCGNPHGFIDLGSRSLKGFPRLILGCCHTLHSSSTGRQLHSNIY
jgi:class 3 adenylate cyclase